MPAPIEHKTSVDSTSLELFRALRAGASLMDGHGIRADHQSAGRGRLGRVWQSVPQQSLLCSWWFGMEQKGEDLAGFSLLPGLAVLDVLDELGFKAGCKWPNDIRVSGRKLAGILTEFSARPSGVVIGIGLNIRRPRLEEGATALEDMDGLTPLPGASELALLLQGRLQERVEQWKRGQRPQLLQEWLSRCDHKEGQLLVTVDGIKREVRMLGLGDRGQLLVLQDGQEREVWVDDVMPV